MCLVHLLLLNIFLVVLYSVINVSNPTHKIYVHPVKLVSLYPYVPLKRKTKSYIALYPVSKLDVQSTKPANGPDCGPIWKYISRPAKEPSSLVPTTATTKITGRRLLSIKLKNANLDLCLANTVKCFISIKIWRFMKKVVC